MCDDSDNFAVFNDLLEISLDRFPSQVILPLFRCLSESLLLTLVPNLTLIFFDRKILRQHLEQVKKSPLHSLEEAGALQSHFNLFRKDEMLQVDFLNRPLAETQESFYIIIRRDLNCSKRNEITNSCRIAFCNLRTSVLPIRWLKPSAHVEFLCSRQHQQ